MKVRFQEMKSSAKAQDEMAKSVKPSQTHSPVLKYVHNQVLKYYFGSKLLLNGYF